MDNLATQTGYLLLGGMFVWAGIDHFLRFAGVSGLLKARNWPWPEAALAAASVFQIAAGLGLAFDILRPVAALGLAGFTIVASLLLLDFWKFAGPQRDGMQSAFTVNIGLFGGLIVAFGSSL